MTSTGSKPPGASRVRADLKNLSGAPPNAAFTRLVAVLAGGEGLCLFWLGGFVLVETANDQ